MTTFISLAVLLILGVLYVLFNESKRKEFLRTIESLKEGEVSNEHFIQSNFTEHCRLNEDFVELNGKLKDIESKLDKMDGMEDELDEMIQKAYDKIEQTNKRLLKWIEETESLTELCMMAHRTIEILRQKPKDGKYPHLKQDHIEIEKVYGAYKTTQLISDSEEQPIINIKKDDPFLVISVTKELANIALADGNVFTLNRESVMKKLAKP
jgi:predicted nuclease with TOPRIM domain